jgi:hypothetical protein
MAVSIKELQVTPTVTNASDVCEKMYLELQLIRRSIAAAVSALGSEEQIRKFNEQMESIKPA